MDTLLTIGLVCILAAAVGGGLKWLGIEFPALQSLRRQGLLAFVGVVLVVVAISKHDLQQEVVLFDTDNTERVNPLGTPPPQPAEFSIEQPYCITYIWNFHFNDGAGETPGTISLLRRSDGKVFGPWEVTAADLETNWEVKLNTWITPGTYTIIDNKNNTWSWNDTSGRRGMSKVKGSPPHWGRLGYVADFILNKC